MSSYESVVVSSCKSCLFYRESVGQDKSSDYYFCAKSGFEAVSISFLMDVCPMMGKERLINIRWENDKH